VTLSRVANIVNILTVSLTAIVVGLERDLNKDIYSQVAGAFFALPGFVVIALFMMPECQNFGRARNLYVTILCFSFGIGITGFLPFVDKGYLPASTNPIWILFVAAMVVTTTASMVLDPGKPECAPASEWSDPFDGG
jgi:hypothetical protein